MLFSVTKAEEINDSELAWSSLWWSDLEEAGIESVFFALDGDRVIGFQTLNIDGKCVAIEVDAEYQGRGVATALVEFSGGYRPESNENPEFWEAIKSKSKT